VLKLLNFIIKKYTDNNNNNNNNNNNIVICQLFVGLRNGAWLGSRPVNKSSAQP
jgi:hypothetical protein